MDKRQGLTLHELLASKTKCHLAALRVICHTRTRSIGLTFIRGHPVIDIAKQDVGRAQQPTEDGSCREGGETGMGGRASRPVRGSGATLPES